MNHNDIRKYDPSEDANTKMLRTLVGIQSLLDDKTFVESNPEVVQVASVLKVQLEYVCEPEAFNIIPVTGS